MHKSGSPQQKEVMLLKNKNKKIHEKDFLVEKWNTLYYIYCIAYNEAAWEWPQIDTA